MRTISSPAGVTSEVGRLRTVLLHRPGHELRRLTPRNAAELLFDGMPWVAKAQEEHDAFAELLRSRDVEVLYLGELLVEALSIPAARDEAVRLLLSGHTFGQALRGYLTDWLSEAEPRALADVMMAGLRNDEIDGARTLVTSLKAPDDFIITPLPNLFFTRDSSVWVGSDPAVTSLAFPARERENLITQLVYRHHPAFADVTPFYGSDLENLEGGDVLLLARGVVAIGVGQRTTPAGAERMAATVFRRGDVHTVLAVPLDAQRSMMHLDTVCTMVDVDAVTMYPNIAGRLRALTVTANDDGSLHVGEPEPFLDAAARAMGVDRIRVIGTGLDPHTAEREQWDDGNNTLAIAPKVCIGYERNEETNARLEAEGIEVLTLSGSELGSGRGGPRCMSCPIARDEV